MLPVEKCIKNGEPGDNDGYTHAHACTHTCTHTHRNYLGGGIIE